MDELQAVGVPELRDALRFVRGRRRPVSAEELAASQSVHRNVARRRLDRLVDAGLLVRRAERLTGRTGPGAGRPAHVYSPAPETAEIEFPERPYHELVGLLVDALPRRARQQRLQEVGRMLARGLVEKTGLRATRDLRRGLERVCAAVGALGYQAEVVEVGEGSAVIATPTCPLRPLVMARPEVSEVDRGMWSGLIESAVEGAGAVGCTTCDCLDAEASCRIVVTLAQ
jgi:predicted ArsR family transcriptional regulator